MAGVRTCRGRTLRLVDDAGANVELIVEPAQPAEVVRMLVAALGVDGRPAVDPWWRAGLEEALDA